MQTSSVELMPGHEDISINENLVNASCLLSLMHGKNDSLCKLFEKEINVSKCSIAQLHHTIIEKLSLHQVTAIVTSVDISLRNKKILTFKTFDEFNTYDFTKINSSIKSIYLKWDFMIRFPNYTTPQRHTLGVRIASTPDPSDAFKILLSGGFDENADVDVQSCTLICKVDFINNTLAEELINIVETWNDLCECAVS